MEIKNDPTEFHKHVLKDAKWNFDVNETTISHLLRVRHPTIKNKNYSEAFLDALFKFNLLDTPKFIEVGCGTGIFAKNFTDYLEKKGITDYNYSMIELSPPLYDAQRELLKGNNKIKNILGSALDMPYEDDSFKGAIICNEVIADLPSHSILSEDTKDVIKKYSLDVDGLPSNFHVNTGTIKFLEEIERITKKGSSAVILEYCNPDLSKQKMSYFDHEEFAPFFPHLEEVANKLGMKPTIMNLNKFLDINLDVKILSLDNFTHKEEFIRDNKGLGPFWKKGLDMPTTGYTPEMLKEELSKKEYNLTEEEIELIMRKCESYFVKLDDPRFDSKNPRWLFKVLLMRK